MKLRANSIGCRHRAYRKMVLWFFSMSCMYFCTTRALLAQEDPKWEELRSPRLSRLLDDFKSGDHNAVQEFWRSIEKQGTPLIEPIPGDPGHVLTTFLWRAKEPVKNVLVVSGLFNQSYGRDQLRESLMSPLHGTDIWYKTYRVRSDARLTYAFSVDDSLVPEEDEPHPNERKARFRSDPLNPRHASGADSDSLTELPTAPAQEWLGPEDETSKGELKDFQFKSRFLAGDRKIWVYTPAGYNRSIRPYHVAVFMDGEVYTQYIPVPLILDNLLAAGKIAPTVAVFVGNLPGSNQPTARTLELSCYHAFTQLLVEELLPWLHERYDVTLLPEETVVAGVSRGGTAAACAALEHPEIFGNVSSQSGFFVYKDRNWFKNANPEAAPTAESQEEMAWEQYGVVMQKFANSPQLKIRFYLDVGKFENTFHPSPLIANRHLRDVLIAKGYQIRYQEFAGDHNVINWRGTISDGLIYLLGAKATPQ